MPCTAMAPSSTSGVGLDVYHDNDDPVRRRSITSTQPDFKNNFDGLRLPACPVVSVSRNYISHVRTSSNTLLLASSSARSLPDGRYVPAHQHCAPDTHAVLYQSIQLCCHKILIFEWLFTGCLPSQRFFQPSSPLLHALLPAFTYFDQSPRVRHYVFSMPSQLPQITGL